MAVDKNKRELATAIMKAKGQDYDEWLNGKHQDIIEDNAKLLIESLFLKTEKNTSSSFDNANSNISSK